MENTVLRDGQSHHVGYNPFVLSVDQFVKCVLLERCVCIVWLKTFFCLYSERKPERERCSRIGVLVHLPNVSHQDNLI